MDAYEHKRNFYGSASATHRIAAGDTTAAGVITALSALHTIYVQRILCSIITDSNKTLTYQDSANTPFTIGGVKASPGVGGQTPLDFGSDGVPLTQGKNLNIAISGAGLAADVAIEAYQKLTGVGAA
jgi:hypothetical protein